MPFLVLKDDLRTLISQGGLHLEMPPWKEKLTTDQINALAQYVVDPAGNPSVKTLFDQNCTSCHGSRIPVETNVAQAQQASQPAAHIKPCPSGVKS